MKKALVKDNVIQKKKKQYIIKCVFNCDTTGVSIHQFPDRKRFPEKFKAWAIAVGLNSIKYTRNGVCDRHFHPDAKTVNNRVKSNAIPTINLRTLSEPYLTEIELEHNYCNFRLVNKGDMEEDYPTECFKSLRILEKLCLELEHDYTSKKMKQRVKKNTVQKKNNFIEGNVNIQTATTNIESDTTNIESATTNIESATTNIESATLSTSYPDNSEGSHMENDYCNICPTQHELIDKTSAVSTRYIVTSADPIDHNLAGMLLLRSLGSQATRNTPKLSVASYGRGRPNFPPMPIASKSKNSLTNEIIELNRNRNDFKSQQTKSQYIKSDKKNIKKMSPLACSSRDFVEDNTTSRTEEDLPSTVIYESDSSDTIVQVEEKNNSTNVNKSASSDTTVRVVEKSKSTKVHHNSRYLSDASNSTPVFDSEGNLIYIKMPDKDPELSKVFVQLKSKKEHGRCGFFIVEGWRLIVDGLKSDAILKMVVFSDKDDLSKLKPFMPQKGVKILKIPYKEIKMWSDLDTSPGLIAVFKTPVINESKILDKVIPINIICDNIRDPGNLGAILRMADGVGCHKVLLTKGCVNIWDSKVIRSAGGAHFRLFLKDNLDWDYVMEAIPEESKCYIADNNTYCEEDDSFTFEKRLSTDKKCPINAIPTKSYYDVDYRGIEPVFVVIGGETKGVSEDCYRFLQHKKSVRINIPLRNNVNSLNAGMALAVVIFEIKRQMTQFLQDLNISTEQLNVKQ